MANVTLENMRGKIASYITVGVFAPLALLMAYSAFTGNISIGELILLTFPLISVTSVMVLLSTFINNGKLIIKDNKIIIYNYSNEILIAENRKKKKSISLKGLKPRLTEIYLNEIQLVVFGEYKYINLFSKDSQNKAMIRYLQKFIAAYNECKRKRYVLYRYNYRGLDYTPFIYILGRKGESYLIRIGYEYSDRKVKQLLSALKEGNINVVECKNIFGESER